LDGDFGCCVLMKPKHVEFEIFTTVHF
jgi:hypothetical protein